MDWFIRFMLRLLGSPPKELPEPFSGCIDDVTYDVQLFKKGMVSISVYLSRDRMVVEPICFRRSEDGTFTGDRKIDGSDSHDRMIGHFVGPLSYMGPQSVNIGSTGDRIEAIFAGY